MIIIINEMITIITERNLILYIQGDLQSEQKVIEINDAYHCRIDCSRLWI